MYQTLFRITTKYLQQIWTHNTFANALNTSYEFSQFPLYKCFVKWYTPKRYASSFIVNMRIANYYNILKHNWWYIVTVIILFHGKIILKCEWLIHISWIVLLCLYVCDAVCKHLYIFMHERSINVHVTVFH